MHFLAIFRYLQISFAVKSSGVDQVLTKILQNDHKLTFDIFYILNQGRISKIEKISDGTDPPKKRPFLDIFFNFGDTTLLQNMKNNKSKFLNDL